MSKIRTNIDINNIKEFLEKEAYKDKLPLYYDFKIPFKITS